MITPMRRQYLRIKQQYPDAILLFRLGDFYEAFENDAHILSKELELVLTSREMGKGQKFPMAGFPHHALDNYLGKLVKRGYKVAICEQLSPPGKGLVKREVVRVVTPGTIVEPGLLEGKVNNYLVAVIVEGGEAGLAFTDITTSEFSTTQLPLKDALIEIERLNPAEILTHKEAPLSLSYPTTIIEKPDLETAQRSLLDHFGATTLEGLGCAHLPLSIKASAAILQYLEKTQKEALSQLTRLSTYSPRSFMTLDASTCRNLELFHSLRFGPSLLSVIDLTKTPMGGRLLRRWLSQPLLDIDQINIRLDGVEWFYKNPIPRAKVISLLKEIGDLERLINRVRRNIASPREVLTLGHNLELIPKIKMELSSAPSHIHNELQPCPEVTDLIFKAISEEEVIKPGFFPELDELRSASKKAKEYLANLERTERERTGIKSLKVGYNQVFGYYIEVTKPNLHLVPPHYIRKQTLVSAERFITPELKEYESLILHAEDRIEELQNALFRQVCQQISSYGEKILSVAKAIAYIDVLSSLAEVAIRYGYTRPKLNNEDKIIIKGGRHPVVERTLTDGFVPNDVYLSNDECQIIILTGPNMSGKSTYIRQVALIVLLAQIGSFVPADSAIIGIVDRIFSRVGLMDDIASGQSTFMVEMIETANILHNATPRSLIILDEIGRGTSTYDGIAIAKAVAEYIHNHPQLRAKTLFATHYHELIDLAKYLPRVRNYKMAVAEEEGKVVFLRKVVPGGADKSYGIHVAQLAGLPKAVIQRAEEVLKELEGERKRAKARHLPQEQLPLFAPKSPIIDEILKLDLNTLTPLEALLKLYELQKKAKEI